MNICGPSYVKSHVNKLFFRRPKFDDATARFNKRVNAYAESNPYFLDYFSKWLEFQDEQDHLSLNSWLDKYISEV